MRIPLSPRLIFILLFILIAQLYSQTTSVPLSSWAYDAIERWEVRGFINGVFNGTKPYTREEMAKYIAETWQTYVREPEKFSRTDRQQLYSLRFDYDEELKAYHLSPIRERWQPRLQTLFQKTPLRFFNNIFYTNYRNALTFRHGEFNFYADPVMDASREQKYDQTQGKFDQSRIANGFLFRGNMGSYIGFYFNLTDNHAVDGRWENRRIPFEVLQESRWPYITPGDNGGFDFDENVAYVTFNYKYLYVLYGRDYNQWGVGHNGNLMLSTNAPVADQLKLSIRYWRFKFTHLTSFLEYISPAMRQSMKSEPAVNVYWSGNRLELDMGRGVQLGFSEAVVYGNRSLDPGYLNPVTFFKSLEHYYGDRDNGTLGLDLEWRVIPGLKLFGEWFIDDITTTKLGSDFYGNKFAWQGGFFMVNPFSIPDVDFLLEYTRIKPYVYSHTVADYNKYKQYDTILGDYIGPNSDDIFLRLRKRFTGYLQLSLVFEHYRHGANPADENVGGDPDRPHVYGDSENAPFLAGILNEQTSWGPSLQYELVRNLIGQVHFRRYQTTGGDWESLVSFGLSFNFGYRDESFRNIFPLTF